MLLYMRSASLKQIRSQLFSYTIVETLALMEFPNFQWIYQCLFKIKTCHVKRY